MKNVNNEVFARLYEISNHPRSEQDRYEEMLKFLHLKINDKDIEFSKELQKKFDIEYKIIKFDQGYFKMPTIAHYTFISLHLLIRRYIHG